MKLGRTFVVGCVIGFVCSISYPSMASAQEQTNREVPYTQVLSIWETLDPAQKKVVELVAADFFQHELSSLQQNRIIDSQAGKYRTSSPETRDQMRHARRSEWSSRSDSERREALLTAGSTYGVLTENQRAPFRLYAIEKLGLKTVRPTGASVRGDAV